jgi:hypothetical protein
LRETAALFANSFLNDNVPAMLALGAAERALHERLAPISKKQQAKTDAGPTARRSEQMGFLKPSIDAIMLTL